MASPFSIFRKHQKTLMVVLVIGSMVAFTGESLFTAAGENFWLLGAMLGCGLAIIAGFQFGRPIQYAVGGALVGGLLGFFGPWMAGGSGFASELGSFDEKRMTKLISERRVANDFIQECRRRSIGPFADRLYGAPFQYVYPNLEQDVIIGEALRAEADEMGITVDDDAVNQFIDQNTAKKLRTKDFLDVRKQLTVNGLPMSDDQLFDLLRNQIKAKLALQTLMPYRDQDTVTPETYWTMYNRMNVRQQMAFTPVPVDSFLDQVGEPSDSDIAELFDKYKDKLPNPETGEPGFYQRPKMKLAYVEADYASIESDVAEVSEEDINKYYEDNKKVQFRDLEAELPEDPDEEMDLKSLEQIDKDNAEADKKDGESEGDAQKPDDEGLKIIEEQAGEANEEKKETVDPEKEKQDGDCGVWQDEEAQAGETETVETEEATPPQDPPSCESSLQIPSLPMVPSPGGDPLGDVDPFEKPMKFKPLEEVRDQIKQILVRQKTMEQVNGLIEGAVAEMKRLAEARDDLIFDQGGELDEEGKKEIAKLGTAICRELKQYADKTPGIVYAETPLATDIALLNREEFPIGSAMPPGSQFNRRATNVVGMLMGGGGEVALFEPARAELMAFEFDGTVNQYAYWAIGQVQAHEPKLDEAGLREQIVKAWKRDKARPKAKERAEAIAAMVKADVSEDNTMTDILEDVTQTGDDTSAKLIVTRSLPFTWMKTSSAASPMGMQQEVAQLSQLEGIEGMGNDFMDYVFNNLKSDEVGVTPNSDKSVFYVVQPLNRFPTDEDDVESTRETFLATKHFEFNSPMPGLVSREIFGRQNSKWLKRFEAKHGIDWNQ